MPRAPSNTPLSNRVTSITSLPPDVAAVIFGFLPIPDLGTVARVSRRFKVFSYADEVFEPKLRLLGMESMINAAEPNTTTGDTKDRLVARLRMLPGGQFLPAKTARYVLKDNNNTPNTVSNEHSKQNSSSNLETPSNEGNNQSEKDIEEGHRSSVTQLDSFAGMKIEEKKQVISATLPDAKYAQIIIGSGGIKAALAAEKERQSGQPSKQRVILSSSSSPQRAPGSRSARDVFKQVYSELLPYYLDFRKKQKDSKVFRDYKDLSEIGAVLKRLKLFDQAKFLEDTETISFALESTIEWFESAILGQFERAYDRNDIEEMRENAYADYQLNGGHACVNVFVAKNPVFFDHTYNPSLVASKLPAVTGPSVGYALADDFAKYMDYMLGNCKNQVELISKVFVPDVHALTLFVNKVFEDSISEYLTAILVAAKAREGLLIYLHTLATTVHCCSQFIDFISNNPQKIPVETGMVKKALQDIFKPYADSYAEHELEHLNGKYKVELETWDKRRAKALEQSGNGGKSSYISDSEKTRAHQKFVLNTMKAVLYAPVQLTKTLGLLAQGVGKSGRQSQALLTDAEPIADYSSGGNTNTSATSGHTGSGNGGATASSSNNALDQKEDSQNLDSLNALVSLEVCLHLMHGNKESLGRALIIAANTDVTKLRPNVQKIFIALLKAMGERHMKPAFAIALDRLSKSKPVDSTNDSDVVNMDSLQFFELIHVADTIQQMLDVYYNEDVKLWIDEQDFLSDIVIEKKAFERLLDDLVAGGMDKVIQVLVNQAEYILVSEQLPTDFNPPENGIFDWKPTKACSNVIRCLNAHAKVLTGVAEKNTIEVFFGEVGVRLFNVITKNIRRLQVSQTGAMQLICDLNTYYDWSVKMKFSNVSRQFLVLKELGNVFLADGSEELRKLVHDTQRFQGLLRVEEIYELLQSRTDYKKIQKQVEAKECIIQ